MVQNVSLKSGRLEMPRELWNSEIVTERLGGAPVRMYENRPRRIEQLLSLATWLDDKPHLIQGERVVTFGGLARGSADKARQLAEAGIRRGEHVLLLGWNSPDWVMNFWACLRIGAVPVLANAWWSAAELSYALDLIKPVLVLVDERTSGRVPTHVRVGPWAADENATVGSDALPAIDSAPPGEEDAAVIVFTSGTEGRAKGVVLSHRALLAGLQMMLHITRQLPLKPGETRSETVLHSGPLFHVGGPQVMLRGIAVANTLVFLKGRFAPVEVLSLIERRKVTRWTAVPTMVSRVLEHEDVARRDLVSLRSIGTGGAPISPHFLERLSTGLPNAEPSVAVSYGMTECTGPVTTASGKESAQFPGTSGQPLPCVEVRIAPREDLVDGEILVRSPTLMSGYFGHESSPIDADGWLHTGDLGRLEDGRLWITGRSKDMIIRGGENIAPAAVEKALTSLPEVAEAAVLGVPHADLGEEVAAVVVLRGPATTEHLQASLKPLLASFAIPSRWHIQSEPLPTNQTGKIDKRALRERFISATAA
jgi:acyl-CoA synthetase (AMP-forming)/AMP-acid ligase II